MVRVRSRVGVRVKGEGGRTFNSSLFSGTDFEANSVKKDPTAFLYFSKTVWECGWG